MMFSYTLFESCTYQELAEKAGFVRYIKYAI